MVVQQLAEQQGELLPFGRVERREQFLLHRGGPPGQLARPGSAGLGDGDDVAATVVRVGGAAM